MIFNKQNIASFMGKVKEYCSQNREKLKSGAMTAAAIGACAFTALYINHTMNREPVLELYFEGERVGYVSSKDIYTSAKADAEKTLAALHTVPYRFPEGSATYTLSTDLIRERFLTEAQLSEYLVKEAGKKFTLGYGLYIDETLVAIGENREDIISLLDETFSVYSELYAKVKTSDDIVAFNSRMNVEEMSVPKSIVKSYDEIRSILGLDSMVNLNDILLVDNSLSEEYTIEDISNMIPELDEVTYEDISLALPAENVFIDAPAEGESVSQESSTSVISFKSSAIEVCTDVMPCGEEIVEYDDNLPDTKKILLSSGVYGIKESTYTVEYIDGVEVTRTLVEEKIIKEPVSKKYKVGTKTKEQIEKEEAERKAAEEKKRQEAAAKSGPSYIYAAPGDTPAGPTGTFMYPTTGTFTSPFGGRNLFGQYKLHGGIDIANKVGTDVFASDGGTVIYADVLSSYGNLVKIDHGNGIVTFYAHLNAISVRKGDVVGKGWKIGEMKATGKVTGPHLHFEVLVNGNRVDPMQYISQ